MKNLVLMAMAMAIVLPVSAQIFTPKALEHDPNQFVPRKLQLGPVLPASFISTAPSSETEEYFEKSCKPVLKGSYYQSPSFDSTWAGQLQSELDYILSVNNIPGASLAVYDPVQGLFTGVSGISTEGVPITSEMRFGIASNTKLFIAVTLLRLQEEGVLSLEDQIHQWLPSYSYVDSSATIRQLLNHESGIFDYWNDNIALITDSLWADTSRFWTADEVLATIGPPHFAPGHGWSYSNTNYLLAAMAIEAATGETWVQNLHDFIFDPLMMDSTFVGAFEPKNGPVANEWDVFSGIEITNPPMTAEYSQGHGAAAILTTAQEMVSWYNALFSGNLITASSMEQLTDFDPVSTYGLGLGGFMPWGHLIYNHTGGLLGYISLTLFDTKTGAALSVLYNGRDVQEDPFFPLISVFVEDYPKQVNDAGISSVISPWSNTCSGTVTPVVVLNNFGTNPLTSAVINYYFDDEPVSVMSWTGSLEPGGALELSLPALPAGDGVHTFTCYTSAPNGEQEGYSFNDTVTSDFVVNILPALAAPYTESFDGEVFPPEGWSLGSHIFHDWGATSVASFNGTGSAVKNNYNDGLVGGHYNLDLPLIDISGGIGAVLDFRYAYARYPGNNMDSMLVLISPDCGESWDTLFNKGGAYLATAPNTYELFYPEIPGHWKQENIPLTGYTGEVLIRFRAVCGYGNNLFLDDVLVDLLIGANEIPRRPDFTVYPNPVSSVLNVCGLPVNTEIYLTDITGKSLIHSWTEDNTIVIDTGRLPEGIYILRTPFGSRKIIKI